MKLFKKFKLSFGITTLLAGASLTALSGSLLGVGLNITNIMKLDSWSGDYYANVTYGLGKSNYGDVQVKYYSINGDSVSESHLKENKAEDLVEKTNLVVEALKTKSKEINYANLEKKLKGIIADTKNPEKNPELKTAQDELKTAQGELKTAIDTNKKTPSEVNKGAVKTAEEKVKDVEKKISEIYEGTKEYTDVLNIVNSGYDMMLSGAILFPIFVIVTALGIAITTVKVIENKKKPTSSAE